MPPKRREQTDKNKEDDNMPELKNSKLQMTANREYLSKPWWTVLKANLPANVRGNGNENPRPHLHQLYNVTNPVNQPDLCEEVMGFPVESTDINADNGAYEARGARFYNHPLQNRNTCIIDLDLMFDAHKNYGGSTAKHVRMGSPGNVDGSTASRPRNRYFPRKTRKTYYPGDVYHQMSWVYQREEENCLKLQPVSTRKMHGYSKKNESTIKTQRVRAAGHHDRPMFVLPPRSDVSDTWRIAQHKKFPKSFTRTQKRRMLRQRAAAKPKTTENTVSKSKSCIKATEGKSSKDGDDLLSKEDAQENRTFDFSVGKFHISIDCNTDVVIFPEKFKLRSVDEEKSINHRSESVDTKKAEILQESSDVIREEHPSKPKVFPTNDTIGSLPSLYALLLVNSPANFQALLGRDWVLANQCIPSPMHQLLLFRKDDEVEIVEAYAQPFQADIITRDARYYNGDFGPIRIRSLKIETSKSVCMESTTPNQILEKIIKSTVIVPNRPVIQPIMEELDD
ncbi:hypothetical protein F511_02428 [Dorcoceras hygrometricum]|nr:hypothetical protein F511_02428 [Dorcoceras hygrometricum]